MRNPLANPVKIKSTGTKRIFIIQFLLGAQGTHEKNVSKLLRLSWEAEKIKPKQGKSAKMSGKG